MLSMKRQNTGQAHNHGDNQNNESSQALPLNTQHSYSGGEWRKLQGYASDNLDDPKTWS
jgi:hypothetical protein